MFSRWKFYGPVLGVFVALIVAGVVIGIRCDHLFTGRTAGVAVRPSIAKVNVPPGFEVAPVVTTSGVVDKLKGKKNDADEATAAFAPGSEVIRVTVDKPGTVDIGILPDGTVVGPAGVDVVVFKKSPAAVMVEAVPAAFAVGGLGGGTVGGGLLVVKAWRVHAGPAAGVSLPSKRVSLGGTAAGEVTKHFGIGGYVGSDFSGGLVAGAGVELILQ